MSSFFLFPPPLRFILKTGNTPPAYFSISVIILCIGFVKNMSIMASYLSFVYCGWIITIASINIFMWTNHSKMIWVYTTSILANVVSVKPWLVFPKQNLGKNMSTNLNPIITRGSVSSRCFSLYPFPTTTLFYSNGFDKDFKVMGIWFFIFFHYLHIPESDKLVSSTCKYYSQGK